MNGQTDILSLLLYSRVGSIWPSLSGFLATYAPYTSATRSGFKDRSHQGSCFILRCVVYSFLSGFLSHYDTDTDTVCDFKDRSHILDKKCLGNNYFNTMSTL